MPNRIDDVPFYFLLLPPLHHLLNLFAGKKGKAKSPASINREPYRQRLADALHVIRQHPAADAGSRLDVLRALTPTLETVFTEWATAGERDPAVRELGELVVALHALLAEALPTDAKVQEVWTRAEGVIAACLLLCGASAKREGFWK